MAANNDDHPMWDEDNDNIEYIEGPWGIAIWGQAYDDLFLEELKFARRFVPMHRDEVVSPILSEISGKLTHAFGVEYTLEFLNDRYSKLKERYVLFGYVLAFPYVRHNAHTNEIRMPREIQAAILHDNQLAGRYLYEGDAQWIDLKFLFDSPYENHHDPELYLHPASRVDRMNFYELPSSAAIPDSHIAVSIRYCDIYNEVYRPA